MNRIDGTEGPDDLFGTSGVDHINGLGGNDSIRAGAGDDWIKPGTGDDSIDGGDGEDLLLYQYGSPGIILNNTSEIRDGVLPNTVKAVDGSETDRFVNIEDFHLSYGDDAIYTASDCYVFMLSGNDTAYISDASVHIFPGSGSDEIIADQSNASHLSYRDGGWDTEGVGEPTIIQGISVNYYSDLSGRVIDGWGDRDTFEGINRIDGTHLDDVMSADGTTQSVRFEGLAGDDTLIGGSGDDRLYGGYGNDTVRGGAGDDTIIAGGGSDTFDGGEGSDTLLEDNTGLREFSVDLYFDLSTGKHGVVGKETGIDEVISIENYTIEEAFNVTLTGDENANRFTANAGADILYGFGGDDALSGGAGNDTLQGGLGDDTLDGGSGDDTLTGGAGADTFVFKAGFGSDVITDFNAEADALKFYDTAGNRLPTSALTQTQNANGDAVLSVSGGSSVTLEGVSQYSLPSGSTGAMHTITKTAEFPDFDELFAGKYDDLLEVNYTEEYGGSVESLWGLFSQIGENYYTMYFGINGLVTDNRDILSGEIAYAGVWRNTGPFELTEEWDNGQSPLLQIENISIAINDVFSSFDGQIDFEALVAEATGNSLVFEGSPVSDGITASPKNDILNGNAGDDDLEGGDGNDTLDGGAGDDTLTGGAGADTFVFQPGFGSDVITDFDADADVLEFYDTAGNLLSTSALTETQNANGDAVLGISDGSSVTLEGVSQYSLPSETVGAISATNSGSGSDVVLDFYVDPSLIAEDVTAFDMVVSFDSDGAEYVSSDLGEYLGFPNISGDTITLSGISLAGVSTSDPLFTLNFTDLEASEDFVIEVTDVLVNDGALEGSTLLIGGPEALDVSVSVASRSGTALSDVVMSFNDGSDITTATSSLAGLSTAAITSGSDVTVTGALDYDAASKSITSQDALDALRLSVGMDTQNGSSTAFDYIAADFNQDGRVTSSDALDILKNAVGLPTNEQPEWVFVDSNGDYSDVSRLDASYEDGLTISGLSEATTVSLTGILIGDVNDSHSAKETSSDNIGKRRGKMRRKLSTAQSY